MKFGSKKEKEEHYKMKWPMFVPLKHFQFTLNSLVATSPDLDFHLLLMRMAIFGVKIQI
jgi:hypothetical protein